jgi:hypothetical protein
LATSTEAVRRPLLEMLVALSRRLVMEELV